MAARKSMNAGIRSIKATLGKKPGMIRELGADLSKSVAVGRLGEEEAKGEFDRQMLAMGVKKIRRAEALHEHFGTPLPEPVRNPKKSSPKPKARRPVDMRTEEEIFGPRSTWGSQHTRRARKAGTGKRHARRKGVVGQKAEDLDAKGDKHDYIKRALQRIQEKEG